MYALRMSPTGGICTIGYGGAFKTSVLNSVETGWVRGIYIPPLNRATARWPRRETPPFTTNTLTSRKRKSFLGWYHKTYRNESILLQNDMDVSCCTPKNVKKLNSRSKIVLSSWLAWCWLRRRGSFVCPASLARLRLHQQWARWWR